MSVCELCGCSEARPCLDDETGEPCRWVREGLCSSCTDAEARADEVVEPNPPGTGRFPEFHPRQVA